MGSADDQGGVARRPGGGRQTTRGGSPDDQGGVARRPGGGRQTTRGGSPDDHESLNESLKESTNEPINEPPQEKQASERFGDQLGGGCGCDAMDNAMDGVTANDARPVIYSQPPPGRTVADFFVMHPMCYRRDCRDEWQALLSRAGWDIMCQAYDEAARRKPDGKLLFVSDLTDVIVWDEED